MRNPFRLKNLRVRFLVLYLAGCALVLFVHPEPVAWWVGLVGIVAGALLRGWGAGHLVKGERLTITGPYAWVRHPLYLGTLLVGVGFALMLGGWLSLAILGIFLLWFLLDYFPRKERSESSRLEALHGAVFSDYRAAVPALIPRLHAWRPRQSGARICGSELRWSLERYSENNELGALLGLLAGVACFGLRMWWVQ
jgi:protein-S-isoprenylcysteine O-methyltransferase Ste14